MKENEKIDRGNARILHDIFEMKYAEIARLYNSSKEAVSRIFRDKSVYKSSETTDEANEYEIELIEKMVNSGCYSYKDEDYEITLINNLKGKYGFLIISKKGKENKFIYGENIENNERWKKINSTIKRKRMNELSEEEAYMIDKSEEVKVMNKICFCPNDYKMFHKYKKIRNLNEDNYTKFLGYDNYISKKVENTDDKIVKFFDENLIDGKVYISSEEHWLYTCASRSEMSIEEFVNFFGYEKYNNRNKKIKGNKNKDKNKDKDNTQRYRKELLEKIRIEQKQKDRIREIKENEKIIVERDKELINDLKELYKSKCQICRNEGIKEIKQKDGKIYSEAHHIKELANYKDMTIEKENEVLDNYKNVIILCPYHHRYLHYNEGGNYRLIKENDKLFLINDSDKVEIELDYHLKDNFTG